MYSLPKLHLKENVNWKAILEIIFYFFLTKLFIKFLNYLLILQ